MKRSHTHTPANKLGLFTNQGRAGLLRFRLLSLLEHTADDSLQLFVLVAKAGRKARRTSHHFASSPLTLPLLYHLTPPLEVLQPGLKLAVSKNKFPVEFQRLLLLPL